MTPATIVPVTYKAISSVTLMPKIDTARLFGDAAAGTKSPIDIFFLNTNNINKLYLNYPTEKPGKPARGRHGCCRGYGDQRKALYAI